MPNITSPRDAKRHDPASEFHDTVAAATKLILGAMYGLDASGNAVNMESGVAALARGEVVETVDNTSGSAGDLSVRGRSGQYELHVLGTDTVTRADIGNTVYAQDNQTIRRTSNGGAAPIMGKLVGLTPAGKAVVQVGPTGETDGDLVAANNLSDVANAATARANIGANVAYLQARVPLDADETFYIPLPDACTVLELRSAVEGATLAAGSPTITSSLDGTPITAGVLTLASGSVVGTKDTATPSGDNVAAADDNLELAVAANSQSATAFARVTIKISY